MLTRFLFALACVLSMASHAQWDYVMPIVLRPLLDYVREGENLSHEELQMLYQPRTCKPCRVALEISESKPSESDRLKFDAVRKLYFDKAVLHE